jgi:hypothetical protein
MSVQDIYSTTCCLYCGDGVSLVEERIVTEVRGMTHAQLSWRRTLTDGITDVDISYVPFDMVDEILRLK